MTRRIVMLTIGTFLFFWLHVIDLVFHVTDYEILIIFMAVGGVAGQFVMWFVLAHKEILGNERQSWCAINTQVVKTRLS